MVESGSGAFREEIGHLTDTDEKAVISLVASCDFIDEHEKKVFRIGFDNGRRI